LIVRGFIIFKKLFSLKDPLKDIIESREVQFNISDLNRWWWRGTAIEPKSLSGFCFRS